MIDQTLLRRISLFLIRSSGLSSRRHMVEKICARLFDDLDIALLKKNQKFDFSFRFSPDTPAGLRMTYNDYAEKWACRAKFLDVFSALSSSKTTGLAEKILNIAPAPAPFQTTLGLEWIAKEKLPRLKLYLEELDKGLSETDRKKCLQRVLDCLRWDPSMRRRLAGYDPAAIAVDFMPDDTSRIKLYFRHLTRREAEISLGALKSSPRVRRFLGIRSQETAAFYATSYRWSPDDKTPSGAKLYKVYAVRQIKNFNRCHADVRNTLESFDFPRSVFQARVGCLRRLCRQKQADLYPVLLAIDPASPVKIDAYYALRNLDRLL